MVDQKCFFITAHYFSNEQHLPLLPPSITQSLSAPLFSHSFLERIYKSQPSHIDIDKNPMRRTIAAHEEVFATGYKQNKQTLKHATSNDDKSPSQEMRAVAPSFQPGLSIVKNSFVLLSPVSLSPFPPPRNLVVDLCLLEFRIGFALGVLEQVRRVQCMPLFVLRIGLAFGVSKRVGSLQSAIRCVSPFHTVLRHRPTFPAVEDRVTPTHFHVLPLAASFADHHLELSSGFPHLKA